MALIKENLSALRYYYQKYLSGAISHTCSSLALGLRAIDRKRKKENERNHLSLAPERMLKNDCYKVSKLREVAATATAAAKD